MMNLKELWINVCVAAIGINIALIISGLFLSKYNLIPLPVVNCLLLSTVFLNSKTKDDA